MEKCVVHLRRFVDYTVFDGDVRNKIKMSQAEVTEEELKKKSTRASRKKKNMEDFLVTPPTPKKRRSKDPPPIPPPKISEELLPKKGRFSGESIEPPPLRDRHLPQQISLINPQSEYHFFF